MIAVVFKENFKNGYGEKQYMYNNYEGANEGDIVVVNTYYGLAIAKVVKIDILPKYDIDLSQIKSVVKVIKTQKEIEQEQKEYAERQMKMAKFAQDARKAVLLSELKALNNTEDAKKLLDSLSNEELEKLYKTIKLTSF